MRTLLLTALAATVLTATPQLSANAAPLTSVPLPVLGDTAASAEQVHYYRYRHHRHWRPYYRSYDYYPYSYGYVNPGFSLFIGPRFHRHRHWRW